MFRRITPFGIIDRPSCDRRCGDSDPGQWKIDLTVKLATALTDVAIDCAIGKVRAVAATGPLTLKSIERGTPGKPNRVVLDFLATRNLSARLYSKQRFLPAEVVSISRLRTSTNRTFAVGGDTEPLLRQIHSLNMCL